MSTRKKINRKASRGNRVTRRKPYRASTTSSRSKLMRRTKIGPPIRQIPEAPIEVNNAYRIIQEAEYKDKLDKRINIGELRKALGIMNEWEAGTKKDPNSPFSSSDMDLDSTFSSSDMELDSPSPKKSSPVRRSPIRVQARKLTPGEKNMRKYRRAVARRVNIRTPNRNDPNAENITPSSPLHQNNQHTTSNITPPSVPPPPNDENAPPVHVSSASKFLPEEGLGLLEENRNLDAMYGDTMGDEGNNLTPIGLKVLRGPMGAIFADTEERKRLENLESKGENTPRELKFGGKRRKRKTKKRNKRKSLVKKKKTRRKRKKTRRRRKTKKKGGYIFETTYAAHNLLSDFTN